ncbi:hypothetical protein BKA62DRAFT_806920 [Auriculariales sp. MPI-PUGE-AT-0066]|nr:hypothetical protein BKA62DRAFT_806920 [Auriculariales sp. MPI-PUGE-AT-0066]
MSLNWNDPTILYHCGRAYLMVAHFVSGMYIWEFMVTLGFDWAVLRRKRRLTFGTLLYILPRYTSLLLVIVILRISNVFSSSVDCKTWIHVLFAAAFGTIGLTSGILYIRICALSGDHKAVKYGMGLAYLGYWGLVAYSAYQPSGYYVETLYACSPANAGVHRTMEIYMFCFDLCCLSIALRDRLFRLHLRSIPHYPIFTLLNLNDPMTASSGVVGVFLMTVCSTRMQRQLLEYFDDPKIDINTIIVTDVRSPGLVQETVTTYAKTAMSSTSVDYALSNDVLEPCETPRSAGYTRRGYIGQV